MLKVGLSKSLEAVIEIICFENGKYQVWCSRPYGIKVRYTSNERVMIGEWIVEDCDDWIIFEIIPKINVDDVVKVVEWPTWQVNQVVKGGWSQLRSVKWAKNNFVISVKGDKTRWGIGHRDIGKNMLSGEWPRKIIVKV